VAIGTVVEFMAFSDPDMLASMTKSTQFICLLSADWNGERQVDRLCQKRLALQIATQMPDNPAEGRAVLVYVRELMDYLNDAEPPAPVSERQRRQWVSLSKPHM
jgi:hypothetical protein